MADNLPGRGCRSQRTPLLAGLALWLAVAVAAILARRYLYNVLLGPFPLDAPGLVSLTDAGSRWQYYVRIEPSSVTPLFPYAHSGGAEPYAVYALLGVGDRALLARLPARHGHQLVSGTLEELSSFEGRHILFPASPDRPGRRDALPFRLNAVRYFRTTGYLLGVIPLTLAAAFGSWLLALGAVRTLRP